MKKKWWEKILKFKRKRKNDNGVSDLIQDYREDIYFDGDNGEVLFNQNQDQNQNLNEPIWILYNPNDNNNQQ